LAVATDYYMIFALLLGLNTASAYMKAAHSLTEVQQQALKASQDAITVSPKKTNGYQYATSIHVLIGQGLLDSGQDPRNEVKQLVAVAQEGIRQNSADAFLYNALGSGLLLTLFYEEQHKLPYSVSVIRRYHVPAASLSRQ
jgi:hypothetical protein